MSSGASQRSEKFLSPKKVKLPHIHDTGTFLGVSNEIFPDKNWRAKRYFQRHNKESLNEWDIKTDCDGGKACQWDRVHRHAMTSFDYNSLKHRPAVLHLQRNGIPEASKGDKSYQTPEYSPDFHKSGSTRPIANFGGKKMSSSDTYIPLVEPLAKKKTFAEKDRDRQVSEDLAIVHALENWRPSTPLQWRPTKNLTRAEQFAAYHHLQQQQQFLQV
ncbi:uncharacterized protein [Watersipora subatra]|uniref:uncharacterized protein n=1 Tax=Watersipora subatra TaxID=2589382 RepID=UPI00355B84A0